MDNMKACRCGCKETITNPKNGDKHCAYSMRCILRNKMSVENEKKKYVEAIFKE